MMLSHGRTRKRHAEGAAVILFILTAALAFWALALAVAVLILTAL